MRNARLPMRNDKNHPKRQKTGLAADITALAGRVTHSVGTPSETRHAARRASCHNADEMPSQS